MNNKEKNSLPAEVLTNHYSSPRHPFPHTHSKSDQQTKHAIYIKKKHKSSPACTGQVHLGGKSTCSLNQHMIIEFRWRPVLHNKCQILNNHKMQMCASTAFTGNAYLLQMTNPQLRFSSRAKHNQYYRKVPKEGSCPWTTRIGYLKRVSQVWKTRLWLHCPFASAQLPLAAACVARRTWKKCKTTPVSLLQHASTSPSWLKDSTHLERFLATLEEMHKGRERNFNRRNCYYVLVIHSA